MSSNSLNLELRQDTAEMEVTLFDLGETESAIHCEGSMGEYGKVYATLRLKYGMDRTRGTLTSQGRGVVDEQTFFTGTGVGIWNREGSKIHITEVGHIDDGTQNLYKTTVDTVTKKITIHTYKLKQLF